VLPVTTPFESEALKIGFEYSQEAQSLVQLRRRLVSPRGDEGVDPSRRRELSFSEMTLGTCGDE
jgi:hypothetical protein